MSEDIMLLNAKNEPETRSKAQWYEEIFKRSEQQRPVGESQAIAFARFIDKRDDGQILYRAYRLAPGPDWQPPERVTKVAGPKQTEALTELKKLADQVRVETPSLSSEQAFAKALATPRGRELYRQDKNERLGIAAA